MCVRWLYVRAQSLVTRRNGTWSKCKWSEREEERAKGEGKMENKRPVPKHSPNRNCCAMCSGERVHQFDVVWNHLFKWAITRNNFWLSLSANFPSCSHWPHRTRCASRSPFWLFAFLPRFFLCFVQAGGHPISILMRRDKFSECINCSAPVIAAQNTL